MPRGTSILDFLCPILGTGRIWRCPAVPALVCVLSACADFRVQTFEDPIQSEEGWRGLPTPGFLGGSQTPLSVPLAPPHWLNYCWACQLFPPGLANTFRSRDSKEGFISQGIHSPLDLVQVVLPYPVSIVRSLGRLKKKFCHTFQVVFSGEYITVT